MQTARIALRVLRLIALGLPLCLTACLPSFPAAAMNAEGEFIRLEAVTRILEDDELTEAERRDALRELGVTDESLIDLLIRAGEG